MSAEEIIAAIALVVAVVSLVLAIGERSRRKEEVQLLREEAERRDQELQLLHDQLASEHEERQEELRARLSAVVHRTFDVGVKFAYHIRVENLGPHLASRVGLQLESQTASV